MAEQLYNVETPLTHDVFIVGSGPVETITATALSGQNFAKYEAVAIQTATGKLVTFDPAGSGGAEVARYIASYAVDATGGDVVATFYKAGQFNSAMVVFSAGAPTAAQLATAFSDTPISLETLRA